MVRLSYGYLSRSSDGYNHAFTLNQPVGVCKMVLINSSSYEMNLFCKFHLCLKIRILVFENDLHIGDFDFWNQGESQMFVLKCSTLRILDSGR